MNSLEEKIKRLDLNRLPQHVAMIMDGNGRWAKQRSKERSFGHYEGVGSVIDVTHFSSDLGIKYLTLYGFSTENWNRPKEEVDILMNLIGMTVEREAPELKAHNVRLRVIGEIERIPEDSRRRLEKSIALTADCTGLLLTMALSYSSRWEITEAIKQIAKETQEGKLSPENITSETISQHLATYPTPDPDLMIRTGGEERISNFLLWQSAYSEFYFTPTLWPDFGKEEYADALYEYQQRERRFGKTSQQVSNTSTKDDDAQEK